MPPGDEEHKVAASTADAESDSLASPTAAPGQYQDFCLRASIVEDYAACRECELTVSKGQQVEIIRDRSRRASDQEDKERHAGPQWCLVRVLGTSGSQVESSSDGCGQAPQTQMQGYVPASTIGLSPEAAAASTEPSQEEHQGKSLSVSKKLRKSLSKLFLNRRCPSFSSTRSRSYSMSYFHFGAAPVSEDAITDSVVDSVTPIATKPVAADEQHVEVADSVSERLQHAEVTDGVSLRHPQHDSSEPNTVEQMPATSRRRSLSMGHLMRPTPHAQAKAEEDTSSAQAPAAGSLHGSKISSRSEKELCPKSPEEIEKCYRLRRCALQELVETERIYVEDLGLLVHGYMEEIKQMAVLPDSILNKDKIVFGNVHQIYDFHKDKFLQEITKCIDDPHRLGILFPQYEKRLLTMYVKYCENKPKSECIVVENEEFFRELQAKLQSKPITDLLIKPVQRFLKYQLLLKEIHKNSKQCSEDCTGLEAAIEVMNVVPKAANDMMNAGRLKGFDGNITAQGKLLHQDKVMVVELGAKSEQKPRERHVFVFEQIIIFSEALEGKTALTPPTYIFKNKLKVNNMSLESCSIPGSNSSQTQGLLLVDKTPGSDLRLVLHPADIESRTVWLNHINSMLKQQQNMILALIDPVRHQSTSVGGDCLASSPL